MSEEKQSNPLDKIAEALKQMAEGTSPVAARYCDSADIKQELNISDRTLYRWRKSGKLAYTKLGGKYYYRRPLQD